MRLIFFCWYRCLHTSATIQLWTSLLFSSGLPIFLSHRRRSSVNFGGQDIFVRKYIHEKLTKFPILHNICPKNYVWFCTIFARNIFPNFFFLGGGGAGVSCSWYFSLRLCLLSKLHFQSNTVHLQTHINLSSCSSWMIPDQDSTDHWKYYDTPHWRSVILSTVLSSVFYVVSLSLAQKHGCSGWQHHQPTNSTNSIFVRHAKMLTAVCKWGLIDSRKSRPQWRS